MTRYVASCEEDILQQILVLQRENLRDQLSEVEAQEQGFVYVEHDLAKLKKLGATYPHIVALDENNLVGYNLVMLQEDRATIPSLIPLFEQFDALQYEGRQLNEWSYCVCGQVCVKKSHRGQGVFAGMYEAVRKQMQPHFELLLTEIAVSNKRSLRAHEKIGFEVLNYYIDTYAMEWATVIWDWRK